MLSRLIERVKRFFVKTVDPNGYVVTFANGREFEAYGYKRETIERLVAGLPVKSIEPRRLT